MMRAPGWKALTALIPGNVCPDPVREKIDKISLMAQISYGQNGDGYDRDSSKNVAIAMRSEQGVNICHT